MKKNRSPNAVQPVAVARIISSRCKLPLPENVAFLDQLGFIESRWRFDARNGSFLGLYQFGFKRANDVCRANGAYHVHGGFCEALGISYVSSKDLLDPFISTAIALDCLIWANVTDFESFYCLHILPGAYMLLEKGDKKSIKKGLKLFNKYVFGSQSREAELVVAKGIQNTIGRSAFV